MKSLIKNNKSDLIELRFCYIIFIYIITFFLAFGCKRNFWGLITFLPLVRIIFLYSCLPTLNKIITKICQSVLIMFFISYLALGILVTPIFYGFNSALSTGIFFPILKLEVLLILIFHRYILFTKQIRFEKYILPIYRMYKKCYVDIILVIICYVIVHYSFLPGDTKKAFSIPKIVGFLLDFKKTWQNLREYTYLYMIYIGIAGIWYIVGKIYNKKKNQIII